MNMKHSVLMSLDLISAEGNMTTARTCFTALCILRKQQLVTSDNIRRLWGTSGDDAEEMIKHLERFGIAQVQHRQGGKRKKIGLHDVLLEISRELAAEESKVSEWSKKLVVSYGGNHTADISHCDERMEEIEQWKEWWLDVEYDGYIFCSICRLLKLSECFQNLTWLMSNAEWIMKQFVTNGHRQVQEDTQLTIKEEHATSMGDRTNREQVVRFLKVLESSMHLSAKRVRESKWDGTPWFDVYGRIVHLKEKNKYVRRLVEELEEKAP